ncbi:hypothetical protein [Kaistella carnis]|uniref:Uncharacterized protein n=1 Tax=Kaistella carnis TaxID=1241979 RepID=A0A3G8XML4_9FLAO|nr:hypothetical protein [Kaistella carnis]AZI34329.1 hypothetical protein EIB73_14590 [Kaistella carnis]
MKNLREPFYELEIKTANCFIEILINDFPVFSNFQDGGMAVDYPINDAILHSGKHVITVKISSPKKGERISIFANCELKVFVKEANLEASGRNLVHAFPAFNFKENNLPMFVQNSAFQAEVPYINLGWAKSLDLTKIEEKQLLAELNENLSKITEIYNTRNENEYLALFDERTKEHIKSFYLTKEEIKDNNESIFYGLPKKIESIDSSNYKLVFFGEGKMVSLQAKKQSPGFVFESVNKDEYGFTEMVLFHKKNSGSQLEIIR